MSVKQKNKPRVKFTISKEAHQILQLAAASVSPPVRVSFLLEVLIRKHLRNFNPAEHFDAEF